MTALPESASFNPFLPDVYRFAFLMAGDAATAAAVLRRTVERAAREGIGDLRDSRRVKRWLFTEARHQCAQPVAHPPTDPAATLESDGNPEVATTPLAARFVVLPVPERSALILFYLYLFDPADLAQVLEIPLAELAPLLVRARASLGAAA